MERYLDRVQATPERNSSENNPQNAPVIKEIKISGKPIPETIMDDLCARFLLNIPDSERLDMIRLMFQIEQAHWFYIDFYRAEDKNLPEMRLPQFAARINECVGADLQLEGVQKEVPTFGAIIMDKKMTHCILVQGNSERASWGFPKGKVNIDESPEKCAQREVLEEVGYDVSPLLDKRNFIEVDLAGQINRLYLCPGCPLKTEFVTQTRNEISSIKWFPIDALPLHKKDTSSKEKLGMGSQNFYMVTPFVSQLKHWIQRQQFTMGGKKTPRRNKRNQGEGSDEDIKDIPPQHSSYIQKPKQVKKIMQRARADQRASEAIDSSDEENDMSRSDGLKVSPGAAKRILKKHWPREDGKDLAQSYQRSNLMPDRALHSRKNAKSTQAKQKQLETNSEGGFIPEAWRNFSFDMDKIRAAMFQ
ncbi:Oidioi.mRNA.OKI2018_I69.PAR.g10438.t1.cds [Oikopleura dioica]|uniref:Oidioi.mRNA.OKI2018_I69.PAR.g10438.t1.cds n=1 Tax=Oikopleura dioica TaxID=34765 RepID=A0ABN7RUW7_OIKDI|nr:Oidioi.mRNA.OKI2018_I69.PAR.g10438.t1.cds [Oikopleura dioica]